MKLYFQKYIITKNERIQFLNSQSHLRAKYIQNNIPILDETLISVNSSLQLTKELKREENIAYAESNCNLIK